MPAVARAHQAASWASIGTTSAAGCGGSGSWVVYRTGGTWAVKSHAVGVVVNTSTIGRASASLMFMGGRPRTSSMVRTKSMVL